MQDDLVGLTERLDLAKSNICKARKQGLTECMAGWEHLAIDDAKAALETLTRERDEARAESRVLKENHKALCEAVDIHAAENRVLSTQLTATQARLADAENIARDIVRAGGITDLQAFKRLNAFLAQQEGQSNG